MGLDISGLGSVADLAKGIVDRFWPPSATPEQKAAVEVALAAEIEKRDQAKSAIMVAEMTQGDNYTKRARPTLVYAGLVMIALNHVIFPLVGRLVALWQGAEAAAKLAPTIAPIPLPAEFWAAWAGVVGLWSLGRSYERAKGAPSGLSSLITGSK